MISKRIEVLIFTLLALTTFFVSTIIVNEIKVLQAPINIGLSPDEVIMKELPVYRKDGSLIDYSYIIRSNTIITLVENELYVGFKNPNSGYMFKDPRTIFNKKTRITSIAVGPDDRLLKIEVFHKVDDYVIVITDDESLGDRNSKEISFINETGANLEKLTNKESNIIFWVEVLETLPEDYKIIQVYNNDERTILSRDSIMDSFGGDK